MGGVKHSVRDEVLERDNFECQLCHTHGTKSNPLTMHHKIFRCFNGQSTVDNLITYCQDCHREYHKIHKGVSKKQKHRRKGRSKWRRW